MTKQSHQEDVHDRTHRFVQTVGVGRNGFAGLEGRHVALELGVDAAASSVARLAFLTLCNLVTRLGPYVPALDIMVPTGMDGVHSKVYPGGLSLAEQALWILRGAIPVVGLSRGTVDSHREYDVVVTIGASMIPGKEKVFMGWRGWMARVGDREDVGEIPADGNPIGAMVAAAMAAARVHVAQLRAIGASIPATTAYSGRTWTAIPSARGH